MKLATTAALICRGTQAASGLILLYVVTKFFSQLEQGYYYLFVSITALQLFFDLGLNVVIINLVSHEWAVIERCSQNDSAQAQIARSRLESLFLFSIKWYGIGSLLLMSLFYFVGTYFFYNKGLPPSQWHTQWIAHLLFSSLSFAISPILAVLEGCNKVASVNLFRAIQVALSYTFFYLSASNNLGLTSIAAFSGSMLFLAIIYVVVINYKFLVELLSCKGTHKVSWINEIFSLQGKISIQAIFSYLGYYALTPLVFHLHGAGAAGQLGLSLQVGMTIILLSTTFVSAKVPAYGILYANGLAKLAHQKWKKDTSLAVLFAFFLTTILFLIQKVQSPSMLATMLDRGLPSISSLLIYIGACALVGVQAIAALTRANKKEILTTIGVLSPILIIVLSMFLSRFLDVQAVVISYFAVNLFVTLPMAAMIFRSNLEYLEFHNGDD
jgi:hypothetical protein